MDSTSVISEILNKQKKRERLKCCFGVKGIILLSLVVIAMLLLVSKSKIIEDVDSDDIVFAAASALASGVAFAHQQWRDNGHSDGDDVDNLNYFRQKNINMTFNGWPRSTTGFENYTHMTKQTCSEIWNSLVGYRFQDRLSISAEFGSLGLCRFYFNQANGLVEYDVRRGRVILTIS